LGVRYVLEGSIRKAGNQLRIAGQLVDASTSAHVWADRYDGSLEDVFDLQDKITSSVAAAIEPSIQLAETKRVQSKQTSNLSAYDLYLRAYAAFDVLTEASTEECLELLDRALAADPEFTWVYGLLMWCHVQCLGQRWGRPRQILKRAQVAARLALEKAKDNPYALSGAAVILVWEDRDLAAAQALIERALTLNANVVSAWNAAGWVFMWREQYERSLECFTRAIRLNPTDPRAYGVLAGMAYPHFFAGRHDDAIAWANKSLALERNYVPALVIKIAAAELAGRVDDREEAKQRLFSTRPEHSASQVRFPDGKDRLRAALRKAGLRE
jgi:TolB-like protein